MAPKRTPVYARLSDDAVKGWDILQSDHGRTFAALVEAIGRDAASGKKPLPARVIAEAAKIDRERRSRS